MNFNGVVTNIETSEQYEKLLADMAGYFARIRYPEYKIVKITRLEDQKRNDAKCGRSPDGLHHSPARDIEAVV